jgi:hypothetical protein
MRLAVLPLLDHERELYAMPRGIERFRAYLQTMTGGGEDVVLPLMTMNPMGKPHCAALVDGLLAIDAEVVARRALEEAAPKLASVDGDFEVALVVADDAMGGWTQRELTECKALLERRYETKKGWIVAPLWTSEPATVEGVRQSVLTAVFRTAWQREHGLPRTLAEAMAQEGRALAFAGAAPWLDAGAIDAARRVIAPHSDERDLPTLFACLYGDERAEAVGYAPLGLPRRAGYAVALADATSSR